VIPVQGIVRGFAVVGRDLVWSSPLLAALILGAVVGWRIGQRSGKPIPAHWRAWVFAPFTLSVLSLTLGCSFDTSGPDWVVRVVEAPLLIQVVFAVYAVRKSVGWRVFVGAVVSIQCVVLWWASYRGAMSILG
jgi:hypothetical protein